jgi:mono/diheme cytochrome c family protein
VVTALASSADPRLRAYGVRVAGRWAGRLPQADAALAGGARDAHPRVRLEAVVAASKLAPEPGFALVRSAFRMPRDRFLEYAFKNAARKFRGHWQDLAASGQLADDGRLLDFLVAAAGEIDRPDPRGKLVYAGLCANCHQPGGAGLPGVYPPLAGSEVAAGEPTTAIRILLHGMVGRPGREGAVTGGVMPPSGLDDSALADVLSFVRSQFGNSAAPVTAVQVAAERARHAGRSAPWSVEELGLD